MSTQTVQNSLFVDPSGSVVEVRPQDAEAVAGAGYQPASAQQSADFLAQQKYGGLGQAAISGLEGAGDALTLGLSTAGERALGVPAEDIAGREKVHPFAHGLGTALGIVAPLVASGGLEGVADLTAPSLVAKLGSATTRGVASALPEASGMLGRIASRAAAAGVGSAIEGAAFGAGQVVHEAALGDPNLTAQSALATMGISGALGGGLGIGGGILAGLAGEVAPQLKGALPDWLREFAGNRNLKAAGGIQSDIARASKQIGRTRLNALGQEMGDLGLVSPFSTPESTLAKADALMDRAGSGMTELLQTADDLAQTEAGAAPSIKAIAKRVRREVIQPMLQNPFEQDAGLRLSGIINDYEKKFADGLTLEDLHGIRKEISKEVYGLRGQKDPLANYLTDALHDTRTILSDELNAGVERAGALREGAPDGSGFLKDWKTLNRRYEVAARAAEFAQKGINRAQGNNFVSPTEFLAGLEGFVHGGPGGVALAGATALARRHGSGIMGAVARRLADALDEGAGDIGPIGGGGAAGPVGPVGPAGAGGAGGGVAKEAAEAAPKVAPQAVAATGSRDAQVVTPQKPKGEPVRYEVIEADSLIPSHQPNSFTPNPAYPKGVQERNYLGQPEEQLKVVQGAEHLNPSMLLTDTPSPLDGPPLVTGGDKRFVLGGNGRSMMIQRAFKDDASREAYRDALLKKAPAFGISPEEVQQLKAPVLVRVVPGVAADSDRPALIAAVRRFNEGMTQQLSPIARAIAESKTLTQPTVESIGELLAGSGDDSLREVLKKRPQEMIGILRRDGVINGQNQTQWLRGGELTDEAKEHIEGMFLGRIMESEQRLQATSPSLANKVERAAPYLMRAAGINPALDETQTVRNALDLLNEAAAKKIPLNDLLRQGSMFGEAAPVDPSSAAMATLLDKGTQTKIGERFKVWANHVAVDPRQGAMFGTAPTGESARKILFEGVTGVPSIPFTELPAFKKATAIRSRIAELVQGGEKPLRFEGPDGSKMLVSMDPSKPGQWRVTRFDPAGEPVGHIEAQSFKSALEEANAIGGNMLAPLSEEPAQPAEKVAALATLERSNKAVETKVENAVSTLVRGGPKAENVSRSEVAPGLSKSAGHSPEDARKLFEKRVSLIQEHAQDPERMQVALEGQVADLSDHAPDTAQALQVASARAVSYLASKIPQHAAQAPLGPKWVPNASQISQFNRAFEAVENPLGILKQAAAGTLTRESLEAVQTVYPAIYNQIRGKIVDRMAAHKGTVPYQNKQMLSWLMGQSVDGSSALTLLANQATLTGPAGKGQQAAGVKPTAKGAAKLTLAERALTPMQASANRR